MKASIMEEVALRVSIDVRHGLEAQDSFLPTPGRNGGGAT